MWFRTLPTKISELVETDPDTVMRCRLALTSNFDMALDHYGDPLGNPTVMSQILDELGRHGVQVMIFHRLTGSMLPAIIPGPGEISSDEMADVMRVIYDPQQLYGYLIWPIYLPIAHAVLFHESTGLSTCRDFQIVGMVCERCHKLEDTVDNLCLSCSIGQDPNPETAVDRFERQVGQAAHRLSPDAIENSYAW